MVTQGRNRVAVTGRGAVTPLGLTVSETWDALVNGRSGIRELETLDTAGLATSIGGEVQGFDIGVFVEHKISRRMDEYAQYALAAAVEAMGESQLTIDEGLAPRVGVLIGSGYGPTRSIHRYAALLRDRGPRAIPPLASVTGAIDSASGEISMLFGAQGPSRAISTACASGADAIGEAAGWIRAGLVDVAIAGGSENCLTAYDLAACGNARALAVRNGDPECACRPFDEDRNGFVMSCGAGVVVLERYEHAEQRGADILAELAGFGATSDAHHWTAPHPEGLGAERAIRTAIADAGVQPHDIDYVNAHGTSTRANDPVEIGVLRRVLGSRATEIPVSSTKSMTGHMIGASGAVEFIISVCAVVSGRVPPTINCERPIDDEIDFVRHGSRMQTVGIAMSNSFGFGGHNAVLIARAVMGR